MPYDNDDDGAGLPEPSQGALVALGASVVVLLLLVCSACTLAGVSALFVFFSK